MEEKKQQLKVGVAVSCFIQQDGKFLLVQEAKEKIRGKWGLPGGKVDEGESLYEALCREVREETGLVVKEARYVGCKSEWASDGVKHIFAVVADGDIVIPKDEILDARWFAPDEIRAMKEQFRRSWVFDALQEYIKTGLVSNTSCDFTK